LVDIRGDHLRLDAELTPLRSGCEALLPVYSAAVIMSGEAEYEDVVMIA